MPTPAIPHFQNALAAHQAGRLDEAATGYQHTLQLNPQHADALHLLGLVEFNKGALDTAEKLISMAIGFAELALYQDSLGTVLTALNRRDRAEVAFRRAIVLDPSNAQAHYNLGVLWLRAQRLSDAEAAFRAAISLRPDFVEAQASLAVVLMDSGRQQEAEATLRHAHFLDPANGEIYRHLGRLNLLEARYRKAASYYRQAVTLAPREPQSHSGLAAALIGLGQHEAAHEACVRALDLDPLCIDAHVNLGVAYQKRERLAHAEASLRKALEIDPSHAIANLNLGGVLRVIQREDEAIDVLKRVGAASPAYIEACQGIFHAHRLKGRLQAAADVLGEALRIAPTHAECLWNLGLVRLHQGNYEDGWRLYEARSAVFADALGALPFAGIVPQWQGELLQGRSLIVVCEQGMGDSLQFCRYLPILKAFQPARVTVICPSPLKRLLEAIEGVDACVVQEDINSLPHHDYWCFMMSLPLRFGTTLQSIPATTPYLRPPEQARARWRNRLPSGGFKVGLVWAGDPRPHMLDAHLTDQRRSLHASAFERLLKTPGVTFVSLQFGATTRPQINEIDAQWRPLDPMGDVTDFADTAAIVECLDLVIAVDTSTAHLAGALNCPVWILSRFDGCWRWLEERDDTPWYPTARLFRQTRAGEWGNVIARVEKALSLLVGE